MKKLTIATQIIDFLRANAASEPQARCLTTVATALSSDFRGFKRVERVISDLVYKKQIVSGHVDNWACVLSLPKPSQAAHVVTEGILDQVALELPAACQHPAMGPRSAPSYGAAALPQLARDD